VSRGLIRSEDCDGSKRSRKYRAEDIFRLSERRELRKNPDKATENALSWGAPILDSAITLISEGQLYYRGYNAIALADQRYFEDVASLLWTGYLPERGGTRLTDLSEFANLLDATPAHDELDMLDQVQRILPSIAAQDIAMEDLRANSVVTSGTKILSMLAAFVVRNSDPETAICKRLQEFWAPDKPGAAEILNAMLVLCADHELEPSTFTARCVASMRSNPCAVVTACLSVLQGHTYREKYFQIGKLFADVWQSGSAKGTIARWLREGLTIPGFSHPLYPEGDPRAQHILQLLLNQQERSSKLRLFFEVLQEVERVLKEKPNLELSLFAVATFLEQDMHCARAIFTLGRCAGWIAHAIEQYQVKEFFRPRARYIGDPPKALL
jgi:citrate synthase